MSQKVNSVVVDMNDKQANEGTVDVSGLLADVQ
jgi:hypothetical protein